MLSSDESAVGMHGLMSKSRHPNVAQASILPQLNLNKLKISNPPAPTFSSRNNMPVNTHNSNIGNDSLNSARNYVPRSKLSDGKPMFGVSDSMDSSKHTQFGSMTQRGPRQFEHNSLNVDALKRQQLTIQSARGEITTNFNSNLMSPNNQQQQSTMAVLNAARLKASNSNSTSNSSFLPPSLHVHSLSHTNSGSTSTMNNNSQSNIGSNSNISSNNNHSSQSSGILSARSTNNSFSYAPTHSLVPSASAAAAAAAARQSNPNANNNPNTNNNSSSNNNSNNNNTASNNNNLSGSTSSTTSSSRVRPVASNAPSPSVASPTPAPIVGGGGEHDPASYPTPYQVPLSTGLALKNFSHLLTPFEQSEILEHQQVYFLGNTPNKVQGMPQAPNNNGYDDERGDYTIVLHDHMLFRYEILAVLGKGSFGQVVKVWDYKTKTLKALKIIRNKKRFHHQALVEVKILDCCLEWDKEDKANVVRMNEFFYFRKHLCITFELLSINLYEFIKNNGFRGFSLGLIRRFAIQMLYTMRFLVKHRIIHCDLKPENILLRQPNKSAIRIIDFGSSCFENERVYTYIQSRFYRSPEVILGLPYGVGIDMWSFGCILSELYTGMPLFPGENEMEQLACIMEIFGVPPNSMVDAATRKTTFFDQNNSPKIVPNSRHKVRRPSTKDLAAATKCTDTNFLSFLEGCLKWNASERFTPDQAFQHPWILESTTQHQSSSQPSQPSQSNQSSSYTFQSSFQQQQQRQQPQQQQQQQQSQHTPRAAASNVAPQPSARGSLPKNMMNPINFGQSNASNSSNVAQIYGSSNNNSNNNQSQSQKQSKSTNSSALPPIDSLSVMLARNQPVASNNNQSSSNNFSNGAKRVNNLNTNLVMPTRNNPYTPRNG